MEALFFWFQVLRQHFMFLSFCFHIPFILHAVSVIFPSPIDQVRLFFVFKQQLKNSLLSKIKKIKKIVNFFYRTTIFYDYFFYLTTIFFIVYGKILDFIYGYFFLSYDYYKRLFFNYNRTKLPLKLPPNFRFFRGTKVETSSFEVSHFEAKIA